MTALSSSGADTQRTSALEGYGTIGFIGLGIMGKPMAQNLLLAGGDLVVYDIRAEPVSELVGQGASEGRSPADVARRSQVVILMLPDSPQVEAVITGEEGVVQGATTGTTVIDMSSIAPGTSIAMAEACARVGVSFIDAPVSGGQPGAIAGTLSIMVGGPEDLFKRFLPLLSVMGKKVVRVGDVGAGNTVKLVNQVMVAVNIAAMSEAMVLCVKAGVEPERAFEAVRAGLAGSAVLEAKMPMILHRQFSPGFQVNLHIKDLRNVLETGHRLGAALPLSALVMEMFQHLRARGEGSLDHSALVHFYEELGGARVAGSGSAR